MKKVIKELTKIYGEASIKPIVSTVIEEVQTERGITLSLSARSLDVFFGHNR